MSETNKGNETFDDDVSDFEQSETEESGSDSSIYLSTPKIALKRPRVSAKGLSNKCLSNKGLSGKYIGGKGKRLRPTSDWSSDDEESSQSHKVRKLNNGDKLTPRLVRKRNRKSIINAIKNTPINDRSAVIFTLAKSNTHRLTGIKEKMRELDVENVILEVEALFDTFGGSFNEDVRGINDELYPTGKVDRAVIVMITTYYELRYVFLLKAVERTKLHLNKDIVVMMDKILERIKLHGRMRLCTFDIKNTNRAVFDSKFSLFERIARNSKDVSNLTVNQKAFNLLYEDCWKNQYRRFGKDIYCKVYKGKTFTRTYKFLCSVEDYIYRTMRNPNIGEAWSILTEANIDTVIKHMEKIENISLPPLEKSRYYHSFQNGLIYDIMQDKCYTIEECPEEVVCSNYHKVDLDIHDDLRGDFFDGDWFDIPTTGVDKILNTQIREMSDEKAPECTKVENAENVQRVFWALIGRLLYFMDEGPCISENSYMDDDYMESEDIPTYYKHKETLGGDNWQRLLCIIGEGGTGKSIILKALKKFFAIENIATASNEMETKFGLQTLYGPHKYFWNMPEVRKNSKLAMCDFLSMVCGEDVLVRIKNKDAKTHTWRSPGVILGNEIMKYDNKGAAFQRRLLAVLFPYEIPVEERDPRLESEVMTQYHLMLVKSNRAYQALRKQMIIDDVPDIMAFLKANNVMYYEESLSKILSEINPLINFLSAGPLCFEKNRSEENKSRERGDVEDKRVRYMPLKDFQKLFGDHCKALGVTKPAWTEATYKKPFKEFGLTIGHNGQGKKQKKLYPRDSKTRVQAVYIHGCDEDTSNDPIGRSNRTDRPSISNRAKFVPIKYRKTARQQELAAQEETEIEPPMTEEDDDMYDNGFGQ